MKALIVVALSCAITVAQAGWERVAETDDDIFYIDPATIRENGNIRKVWEVIDMKRRDPDGTKSTKLLTEYDCNKKRNRTLWISSHSEPMAGGLTLVSGIDEADLLGEYIYSDSPAEVTFNIVCAGQEYELPSF